jgi:hypothetical protein
LELVRFFKPIPSIGTMFRADLSVAVFEVEGREPGQDVPVLFFIAPVSDLNSQFFDTFGC